MKGKIMGLLSGIVGKFPLKGIAETLIQYISNILELIAPDNLTPELKAEIQKYVGTAYALIKNFGKPLVLNTENDLDDAIYAELVEICELAAKKYDLELNPLVI